MGAVLALASWLTMAIIVAILGFQMDTGVWTVSPGFRTAILNPIYLPQLIFRTPFAMVTAGMFVSVSTKWMNFGMTRAYFLSPECSRNWQSAQPSA